MFDFMLNIFRFRIFSKWLEKHCGQNCFIYFIIRPVVNLLIWLVWPLVAFLRQSWYRFRFEISENESRVQRRRSSARKASLINSRAQMIEVCTEASLQPLFQLYLFFSGIIQPDFSASGWKIESDFYQSK